MENFISNNKDFNNNFSIEKNSLLNKNFNNNNNNINVLSYKIIKVISFLSQFFLTLNENDKKFLIEKVKIPLYDIMENFYFLIFNINVLQNTNITIFNSILIKTISNYNDEKKFNNFFQKLEQKFNEILTTISNKNFIDKLDGANFNLDTINISEIELARSVIDKLPDVREDKIREMKRKYSDPNYKIKYYKNSFAYQFNKNYRNHIKNPINKNVKSKQD